MKKRLLEICCDHLDSALAAQAGGAHRIELCAALATDGLTPSGGLLATVKKKLRIPVFVLIRPRPGNFVYHPLELESMLFDIHQCKALGADGIVSGALSADGRIDREATAQLVEITRPLPFTFHKAFDITPDPAEALDVLMDLGVDRVLTSGQAPSAVGGKEVLRLLARQGAGRITILCGGGIRDHNLEQLLDIAELREFHTSALRPQSEKGRSTAYPPADEEMIGRMREMIGYSPREKSI